MNKKDEEKNQLSFFFSLITVFYVTVLNMLNLILPIYLSYPPFFASPFEIGLITGIPRLTSMLFRLPFGFLLDKVNKRIIFMISLTLTILSNILYFYSTSIQFMMFASFLFGISISSFIPASFSMISNLKDENQRKRFLILSTFSASIGALLGAFTLDVLLIFTEIKNAFILSAILVLFGFILFSLKGKEFSETQNTKVDFIVSLRQVVGNRDIALSSIVLSCSRLALISVTTFLPVFFLIVLDQNPELTVTLISIRSLMFIFMRFMLLRNIQDTIGLKRMVILSLFFHSSVSLLSLSNDFVSMIVPVVISGLAHGALYPLTSYIVSKSSNPEVAGLANAYFLFLVDASLFFGSILLGLIAEFFSPTLVFFIAAIINIIGALSVIMIKNDDNTD